MIYDIVLPEDLKYLVQEDDDSQESDDAEDSGTKLQS